MYDLARLPDWWWTLVLTPLIIARGRGFVRRVGELVRAGIRRIFTPSRPPYPEVEVEEDRPPRRIIPAEIEEERALFIREYGDLLRRDAIEGFPPLRRLTNVFRRAQYAGSDPLVVQPRSFEHVAIRGLVVTPSREIIEIDIMFPRGERVTRSEMIRRLASAAEERIPETPLGRSEFIRTYLVATETWIVDYPPIPPGE